MKIFHLKGGDIMTSATAKATLSPVKENTDLSKQEVDKKRTKPKRTTKRRQSSHFANMSGSEFLKKFAVDKETSQTTEKIETDLVFVNKKLIERLNKNHESFNSSLKAGKNIIKLVKPIFKKLEEDDKLPENCDISKVLAELKKKEDLFKQLEIPTNSKKTEKTTKSTQGPHVLPESSKLAESLETLLKEINYTIVKQFRPGESPKPIMLEKQCYLFQEELKISIENSAELTKGVENKLEHLRDQIEDRESNVIPEEHCKSISCYHNISVEQVKQGLEARKKVHKNRKARHDELAVVWENVQIRLQAVESKIQYIDCFTNLLTHLKQLRRDLAGLYGDIESLKEQLKKDKSETYINKCKKEIEGFLKRYADYSKRGLELKSPTAEKLKNLSDQIEKGNPEKTISERKGNLKIYDKTIKENVEKEITKTLKSVDEKKRELKQGLSAEWNSIFTLIDKTLPWDGDRFWYAVFAYNGNLPKEFTFGAWRIPTFISPFQPKPQETDTEKVAENNIKEEQLPNK